MVRHVRGDTFRATGCLHSAVYACDQDQCARVGVKRSLSQQDEIRYRARYELLCASPQRVKVETTGKKYRAVCRGVTKLYECGPYGCFSSGSEEPFLLALRQLEPEVLDCTQRPAMKLALKFDDQGRVAEVAGKGFRTIRLRKSVQLSHETRGGMRACIRETFRKAELVAPPEQRETELVFPFGGVFPRPESESASEARAGATQPAEQSEENERTKPRTMPSSSPASSSAAENPAAANDSKKDGPGKDEPGKEAEPPSEPSTSEEPPANPSAVVRAAIDAESEAVLACVDKKRIVVVATLKPDENVSLSLRGSLTGSPEEECVRSVLSELSVRASEETRVVHLVR